MKLAPVGSEKQQLHVWRQGGLQEHLPHPPPPCKQLPGSILPLNREAVCYSDQLTSQVLTTHRVPLHSVDLCWGTESWPSVPQVPLPPISSPCYLNYYNPCLHLIAPFFSAFWGTPASLSPPSQGPFLRLPHARPGPLLYLWLAAAPLPASVPLSLQSEGAPASSGAEQLPPNPAPSRLQITATPPLKRPALNLETVIASLSDVNFNPVLPFHHIYA